MTTTAVSAPVPVATTSTTDSPSVLSSLSGIWDSVSGWFEEPPPPPTRVSPTALTDAVANGDRDTVLRLLANPTVDINAPDPTYGNSPLHWAVDRGNLEMVELLLNRGANIEARTPNGNTPLHTAVLNRRRATAELLLDRGANINALNNQAWAPIHLTVQSPDIATYRCLLNRGARVDLENGREYDEMLLVANAWGIDGLSPLPHPVNGSMGFERHSSPVRRDPLVSIADALEQYTTQTEQTLHRIVNPREIVSAFREGADLNRAAAERLGKIRRGDLVVIPAGWIRHAITLVFRNGYLSICNRGEAGPSRTFKIDPSRMTMDLLLATKDLDNADCATATRFFYDTLPTALGGYKDSTCRAINAHVQRGQRHPFCAYNSPEAALYTIIALQEIALLRCSQSNPSEQELFRAILTAKRAYKQCTTFFRLHFVNRYLGLIEGGQISHSMVDRPLLAEIQHRLSLSNMGQFNHAVTWHPERFTLPYFDEMRQNVLARLNRVVSHLPFQLLELRFIICD